MAVIEPTPRLSSVLIDKWIRKEIAPIYVDAPVLGILKAKGRQSFNHDEGEIKWRPRFYRTEPEVSPGYPHEFTFTSPVRHKNASLEWRAYKDGEAIPKLETLIGRKNDTAFPNLIQNIIKYRLEDFQRYLQKEVYYDGTNNRLAGLRSFIASTSSQSGLPVGTPSGTYAGISMVLGNTGFGGSWSTGTWPVGQGDAHYGPWSPLTIIYESSYLGGATATWDDQWQEAMRYGYTYLMALQGEKPDVAIWTPELYRKALDSLKGLQQLEVTASSKIVDLGINTMKWDGIEIVIDPFCTYQVAYLLSTKRMNLWSLQSQLIAHERAKDIDTSTEKIAFDSFLQMWVDSPAYFCRLVPSDSGY